MLPWLQTEDLKNLSLTRAPSDETTEAYGGHVTLIWFRTAVGQNILEQFRQKHV